MTSSCCTLDYIEEPTDMDSIPHEAINIVIKDILTNTKYKGSDIDGIEFLASDYGKFISIAALPRKKDDNIHNKFRVSDLQLVLNLGHSQYPTEYIICDGKIFYWYNANIPFSHDMINVLIQYKQAFDTKHMIYTTDGECLVYYMCKSNYNQYKKRYENFKKKIPCLHCK